MKPKMFHGYKIFEDGVIIGKKGKPIKQFGLPGVPLVKIFKKNKESRRQEK